MTGVKYRASGITGRHRCGCCGRKRHEPDWAEVLATDARGRPALLLRRTGKGSLILGTYPLEHMAALTPRVNPDDTVVLYQALAAHAGARRAVTVAEPVTVTPVLAGGTGLAAMDGEPDSSGDQDSWNHGPFWLIPSAEGALGHSGRRDRGEQGHGHRGRHNRDLRR